MPTNTTGGTTTSFFNTPQATDNCYTADEDCVYYFDVMSDDLGGNAKVLWSIDDNNLYGTTTTSLDGTTTTTTNVDSVIDLTVKDATGCVEKSALGASISIVDGKVKYDARALDWLADGQTATDYFTYAIRLGNGTLSWATVKITLTGTNDAPVLTVDQVGGVTEDLAVVGGNLTDSGVLSFADVDLTDTHTVAASYNSATWSGGTLTAGQIAALTAGFTVDSNSWDYALANAAVQFLGAGETITLSFDVTVTDDSGAVNDSDTQTVTLTITGTNDAPVLVDTTNPTAVLEAVDASAQDLIALTGSFSVTDLDVGDTLSASVVGSPTVLLGVNPFVLPAGAAALTAAGAFTLNPTSTASTGGAIAIGYSYDPGAANLDFLRAGQSLTITYQVQVGDSLASSAVQDVTFTITGTNDAPVLSGDLAAPINEGGTYQLTTADLNFTDPDDGAANVTFTVTGISNGTLYVNGVAGNTFTGAQLAGGLVTFQHDGSETLTAGFQVSVEDGNEDLSAPVAQAFNFMVSAVNDAPVNGVPGAQSVNEDTALVFSSANGNTISISDTDAGVGTVRVTLSVANGTLTLGSLAGLTFTAGTNGSGSFTIDGTLAAINTALQSLSYQGNLNYFGPDSLSIVTSDLGNSGSGGALTDSDSVAITVNAVNDAPVASAVTLAAIAEDSGARLITQAELLAGVTDVDGPPATITALSVATGSGMLISNGNGTWTYTPALNDDTSVTFNYTASDGSLSSSSTATLDITPVNDAPVNTLPAGFSTNANTPLKLAGLSVTDVDAGAGSISVALSVATGTLTAADAGGVTVSGSGTASITLSGTLAAINTYLATVANQPTFTPAANTSGVVTLTMTTNDNGNTGAPGGLSDTDMSSITVNAVNANPITSPDVIWASNGTAVTLPWDVLLGNDRDPDGIALALQSVVVTTGTLGGAGTVTVNSTGTFSFTTGATGGTVGSPTTVTLTYTTIDGAGGSATGTITLRVVAVDTGNGQDVIDLSVASVGAYQAAYIDGKAQQDTLTDGGAFSVLIGGDGNDDLNGSAGNDILRGGAGNDDLDGGAGEDMLDLSASTGALGSLASPFIFNQTGSASNAQTNMGNDTHVGMEGVIGTANNDFISGTALNDIIRGGGGDDTLNGAGGTADLLDLSDATAGFTINFSQGVGQTITAAGIGTDTYSNFEGVIGSAFADTINGSTGNDFLRGRGGNDVINGGDGNDTITGGLGADTLTGGNGSDDFVFDGLNGVDTITDFNGSADRILLEDFIFPAIGATVDAGEFVSNSGGIAGDANDFLLFDTATGNLYYDADGNGAGVRILIANITVAAGTIDPPDFLII
jgi:large repetitive protein